MLKSSGAYNIPYVTFISAYIRSSKAPHRRFRHLFYSNLSSTPLRNYDAIFPCSILSEKEFRSFFNPSPQHVRTSKGDYISGHSKCVLFGFPSSFSSDTQESHRIKIDTTSKSRIIPFKRRSYLGKRTWPHFLRPVFDTTDSHFIIHRPYSHRCFRVIENKVMSMKNPTSPALMAPINVCPRRFIDSDTLRLVEFSENDFIPPYAILSHKWIRGSEVRYDEFKRPREETFLMSGYQKIKAACQQASRDGIRLVWLDTCCIDYGRPADIAINVISMYAYYQNAEVCYTYLADIVDGSTLGGSEWFRRGWTLQELLAPRTVIFFNKDWQCIGDEHELRDDIYQRTLIPRAVLSNEQSIWDVDVLTRMSWAAGRRTANEQDRAYCLQGLLGISVEPNYDEAR